VLLLFFFSGYRATNFIVGLTDVSPAITAPTLWNYDLCAQYPGAVGEGATVNLTCTSCMPPRRYLIVQFPVTDFLNFCEIEVYVGRTLVFMSFYSLTNMSLKLKSSAIAEGPQDATRNLKHLRFTNSKDMIGGKIKDVSRDFDHVHWG